MSRLEILEDSQPQSDAGSEVLDSEVEEDGDNSDFKIDIDNEIGKDESEEELEHLVFGDSKGFGSGLKTFLAEKDRQVDDNAQFGTGLEGLNDAELFFTDTGADEVDGDLFKQPDEDSAWHSKHPVAWEDSDDERLTVSLATVPRLRKLRKTEVEDVVDGREYSQRLRKQYEILHPKPDWARHAMEGPALKKRRLSDSDEDVSDEDMGLDDELPSVAPLSKLLQNASSLTRQSGPGAGKRRKLRPEVIDVQRTKDIVAVQPSAVTSLSFHTQLPLLLSSGPSSTLFLHQLANSPPAPTPNPLLTSMHIRGSPLSTTAFHPTDDRIFLSARRRYFHIWELKSGRVEKVTRVYGQQHEQRSMETFKLSPDGSFMALLGSTKKAGGVINVLSASSLQWTAQVRIEGRNGIADFAWWHDSAGLTIAAKSGEISEWSLTDRRIVARWQDEGAVGTTTLALGGQHEFVRSSFGSDRWVAIGSSSGIVNIYDRREWLASPAPTSESSQPIPSAPTPTKTLDHITTPTSHLVFSPDGQVLAMSSKWKNGALRLVHLPSCTVFKNWPTNSTPLGRISSVAFAAGQSVRKDGEGDDGLFAVLAVGSEQGKIRVWEIR